MTLSESSSELRTIAVFAEACAAPSTSRTAAARQRKVRLASTDPTIGTGYPQRRIDTPRTASKEGRSHAVRRKESVIPPHPLAGEGVEEHGRLARRSARVRARRPRSQAPLIQPLRQRLD